MINIETLKGSVRIHGVKTLTAEAGPDNLDIREQGGVAWLTIKTNTGDEVVLFMLYETAQEYASAINACNDREATNKELNIVKVEPTNSSSMEPM